MKKYELSYWTYEHNGQVILLHENEYTKEEFAKIVAQCIVDLKSYMEEHYINKFDDIYGDVVNKLVSDYGFKKLEAGIRLDPFGWENLFKETTWDIGEDDDINLIKKYIEKLK